MKLVTFHQPNPTTLYFTFTHSTLDSFSEVLAAYHEYRSYLAAALAAQQPLHVILNLALITTVDSKVWSCAQQLKTVDAQAPTLPRIVRRLTIQAANPVLGLALKVILPFCVHPSVTVDYQ